MNVEHCCSQEKQLQVVIACSKARYCALDFDGPPFIQVYKLPLTTKHQTPDTSSRCSQN